MFQPIPIGEFEARTGIRTGDLDSSYSRAVKVVSLRDVPHIDRIQVMSHAYLARLLSRVTLVGDPNRRPYAEADISVVAIDPKQLRVVQTFLQRRKYIDFIESFPARFRGFCMPSGISRFGPIIVLGRDKEGEEVMAHYVPPIVEAENSHTNLLDGIHRNFIILRAGASIESVLIRGVGVELPAVPNTWESVMVVDEKPPPEKRFFNLREELFRDLKYVGVDG